MINCRNKTQIKEGYRYKSSDSLTFLQYLFKTSMGRSKRSSLLTIYTNYSSHERFRLEKRRNQIENTFKKARNQLAVQKHYRNPEMELQSIENKESNYQNIDKKWKKQNIEFGNFKNYHQNLSQVPQLNNFEPNLIKFRQKVNERSQIGNNIYNYNQVYNYGFPQIPHQHQFNVQPLIQFHQQINYAEGQQYNNNPKVFRKNQQQNMKLHQRYQEVKNVRKNNQSNINLDKQNKNIGLYPKNNMIPTENILIKFKNYTVWNKILGSGSYSKVYLGIDIKTSTQVAVKEISELEQNQIRCLMSVDSPYIIKLRDHWKDSKTNMTYLVLDLCKKNLREQLKQCEKNKALQYFDHVVKGMDTLVSKKVVHRDLKLQNILVSTEGIAKITDFGLAKDMGNMSNVASLKCGTPYTMAPEIYFHNGHGRAKYNHKCDVWSMGIILHQILYRKHPFNYNADRMHNNDRVLVPKVNGKYDKLIDRSLVLNPHERITWKQFINIYGSIFQPAQKKNDKQLVPQIAEPILIKDLRIKQYERYINQEMKQERKIKENKFEAKKHHRVEAPKDIEFRQHYHKHIDEALKDINISQDKIIPFSNMTKTEQEPPYDLEETQQPNDFNRYPNHRFIKQMKSRNIRVLKNRNNTKNIITPSDVRIELIPEKKKKIENQINYTNTIKQIKIDSQSSGVFKNLSLTFYFLLFMFILGKILGF